MTAQTPPYAIQASSHGAALFRQAASSIFGVPQPGTLAASSGGVVNATDLAVTQNGTPNMSVNVAGGSCWVPQTNAANGGLYFGLNDATVNLAISASNPTNPRIDTVVATVNDAAYAGGTNNWVLQVLTGTPTAGATLANLNGAAGLSASSIPIAYVLVPANATSIVTADLLDARTFAFKLPRIVGTSSGTVSSGVLKQLAGTNFTWTLSQSYGGLWTASSTGWAVPRAGLYVVCGEFQLTGAVNIPEVQLSQNGTLINESLVNVTNATALNTSTWVECQAGDVLGILGGQNSGSTQSWAANFRAACVEIV